MSRIRYIKPEFFTDEDVGALPPLARILFTGLWCEADAQGRLVDKPVTLKTKLLPYDECDVEALLWLLHREGFIQRYEVQEVRYINIPAFLKHQKPHPREPDLGYPTPAPSFIRTPPEPPIKQAGPEIAGISPDDTKAIPSRPGGSEGSGKGSEGEGERDKAGERPQLELVKVDPLAAPPITEVVEFYIAEMKAQGHEVRDSKSKREDVAKALKRGEPVERLKQAIAGFTFSHYHMGRERPGTIYIDLDYAIGTAERVEKNIALLKASQQPKARRL